MDKILKNDFHVHSYHSPCADESRSHPYQILEYAQKIGMETIGFADHFAQYPPYASPKWTNNGIEIVHTLKDEIKSLSTPVRVLIGCEADVIEGATLSLDTDGAQNFDFIIISASHFNLPGIPQPLSKDTLSVARHYVDTLQTALKFDFISTIAHPFKTPGDPLGPIGEYMSRIPDRELSLIAEMAYEKHIAMEINAILARDPAYLYHIKRFILICKEIGVRFTYGSDAHIYNNIGPFPGMQDAFRFLSLEKNNFLDADELMNRMW